MTYIKYLKVDSTAVITLARPDKANAVNGPMLDELDEAWSRAAEDRDVRVIVLNAEGKHFSAGHDMSGSDEALSGQESRASEPDRNQGLDWKNGGLASLYQWESKRYLGYSRRWRDIPKPSIAAVQGVCVAGGLMLCWPCDLIIASEDARFSDPVVRMGIGGVEYHGHTWEMGPRKAKELLFTARSMSADEAEKVGMVNRVVPREQLDAATMALAAEISEMHPFGLAQAKRAVNQTMDVQGFYSALQSAFDIHSTGHGNALSVCGYPVIVSLEEMKKTRS